jgi:hypothetical protein
VPAQTGKLRVTSLRTDPIVSITARSYSSEIRVLLDRCVLLGVGPLFLPLS